MSFILDALRKAERERNLGRTPSLEDVTHAPPGAIRRVRSNRLLILAGVVAALLVLAVVLRPDAPSPEPAAAPVQVLAASPASPQAALAAVEPAANNAATAETAETAETVLDESAPVESLDDLMEPQPELVAAPASPVEPTDTGQSAVSPAPASVPETAAAPREEDVAGVKLLRDMPADYRAAFSSLRIDVHVHDDDPARRWTLINGKKYTEGSTLPEGPRVVEITADGIVFELRGQTSLFPLSR